MNISELTLFSTNLEAQRYFYAHVMEFPLVGEQPGKLVFQAGSSRLVIEGSSAFYPVHFAFIIPGESYSQANIWLKERVHLLGYAGSDIIDFPNWNARAQYFYDADENIVEFIARRDVPGDAPEVFSADHVLKIGEVGLPHKDPEALYQELNTMHTLPKYDGDFKRFGAAGTPEGLFILVNPEKKTWFPAGDKVMPAHLRVRGDYNFEYNNETITAINNPL